jgi:hypothetical protein
MERPPPLPLPLDQLPEAIRRFCDTAGPPPARMMAARGLVPISGSDQVVLLVQLSADPEQTVATAATDSIAKLPQNLLAAACAAALPPSILERLVDLCRNQEDVLLLLAANNATADATIELMARRASETLAERIATNEHRVLRAPLIIEALYKNRNTRMSTVDRMIELAARNNIDLPGIPTYKEHAEALRGELIPEPSDEPLPSDMMFNASLLEDVDGDAITTDKVDGTESIKPDFRPLALRIGEMSKAEKLRLAMIGNAGARSLLVRDRNKTVAMAAINSPQMTAAEATPIAASKEIGEEILRFIGNKRDWLRNAEIKRALVFNPKTPVGVSLRFLSHLRVNDLRDLVRSRGVSAQIKAAGANMLSKKEKN